MGLIIKRNHSWNLSPQDAISIQNELQKEIKLEKFLDLSEISIIAGTDVSYSKKNNMCYAAIIIFSYPDMKEIEKSNTALECQFPYIPGLLSFRELPALLKAFEKIKNIPQLIVFDSQGIAHPRRFGLACHAGLILDTPSIGLAKTRLIGKYDEPLNDKGSYSKLINEKNEKQIGWVIRTKDRCNPMFISPGFKITMEQTLEFALSNLGKYRIPDITRLPHIYSKSLNLKQTIKF